MRHRRAAALVFVVATAAATFAHAAGGGITAPAAVTRAATRLDPPDAPPAGDQAALLMVELVNAERSRRGLPALRWHARVAAASSNHAADMARMRRMQHAGSDGSSAGDRLRGAGFAWRSWGEAVGAGFTTAEPLLAAWLASPGHRAQLLGSFTYVGVGVAADTDGTPYWALVVAS